MRQQTTLSDIARRARLSVSAVSHVLNRRHDQWFSDQTKRRVFKIAKELNYRPNFWGRSLKNKSTKIVGMIFPGLENDYIISLVRSIQREARRHGYKLLIEAVDEKTPDPLAACSKAMEILGQMVVDGCIVFWPNRFWSYRADQVSVPIVLLDSNLANHAGCRHLSFIRVDRSAGVEQATRYLLEHQRRHICLAPFGRRSTRIPGFKERLAGWRRAQQAAGALPGHHWIYRIAYPIAEWDLDACRALGHHLLRDRPDVDAVITNNDFEAIGIMQTLAELGRRVPQDVAVVGTNDSLVCNIPKVKLASIAYPVEELACHGVDRLVRRMTSGGRAEDAPSAAPLVLNTRFVPRESCG